MCSIFGCMRMCNLIAHCSITCIYTDVYTYAYFMYYVTDCITLTQLYITHTTD